MNLSIVIPVFNEEDNVIPQVELLTSALAECRDVSAYEILIVDDGSTDATAQRLALIQDPRVKVLPADGRQGKGAAYDLGFHAAAFETIATLDGDLQNDPASFCEMLLRHKQGADFVQGWRTTRHDSLLKRGSSKIANAVRRAVLKDSFHDIGCAQRVFSKECAGRINVFPGAHRFFPYLAQQAGYNVVECPVGHRPRVSGRSKYGIINRFIGPLKDLFHLAVIQRSVRRSVPAAEFLRSFQIRAIATLAVLGFLLSGILTLQSYGNGDDEQWLLYRGARARNIVKAMFSGDLHTVPASAAGDHFWSDYNGNEEWNYHATLSGEEPWSYHPSFYALVNYQLVCRLWRHWGVSEIPSWHLLNLLMAALALVAVFKLTSEMFDDETALYSLLLFMLFPRFIAHAHYNPKNIPGLAALTLSMLCLFRWVRSSNTRDVIGAGAWMGLAAAVNLQNLEILPIFPVAVLFLATRESQKGGFLHAVIIPCLLFLASVIACLFVLWPNWWMNPMLPLQSIQHFSTSFDWNSLLYFGSLYDRPHAPWHYYPFFLAASIPLLTGFFLALGLWTLRYDSDGRLRNAAGTLLVLWAALPVLLRMNPYALKYNQMRHLFHAVPPLMILAGIGAKECMRIVQNKVSGGQHRWGPVIFCLAFLTYAAGQIIPIHPYEGEYFNEAFRLVYPRNIENQFEFPVWQSTYREISDWLNRNAAPHSVVRIPYMIYVFNQYPKRGDLVFTRTGPADYVVASGSDVRTRNAFYLGKPLFEIRRYNSQLVAIFKVKPTR